MPQPGIGVGFLRQQFSAFASLPVLVESMGGDTVFGNLVHPQRADLQLDALAGGTDDGGVDRAVVILLRRGDVILEAARNDPPPRVYDAECPVAGRDVADDDAESVDVRQLLERKRL